LPASVHIYGMKHWIEEYCPPPPQCYRCQKFGHIARNCKGRVACRKCAGSHEFKNCTRKNTRSRPKCINCDEQHWASFKSCPARLSSIRSQRQRNFIHPAPEEPRRTVLRGNRDPLPGHFDIQHRRDRRTWAQVTANATPPIATQVTASQQPQPSTSTQPQPPPPKPKALPNAPRKISMSTQTTAPKPATEKPSRQPPHPPSPRAPQPAPRAQPQRPQKLPTYGPRPTARASESQANFSSSVIGSSSSNTSKIANEQQEFIEYANFMKMFLSGWKMALGTMTTNANIVLRATNTINTLLKQIEQGPNNNQ
jgi:hypothetical protein